MRSAKPIYAAFLVLAMLLALAASASAAKPVRPVLKSAVVTGKTITIKGTVKLPARSAFNTSKVTIGVTITDSTGAVLKPRKKKLKVSSDGDKFVRNYGFRVDIRVAGPVKIRAAVYDGPKVFGKFSKTRTVVIAPDQVPPSDGTPAPGPNTPPPVVDTDLDGIADATDRCPLVADPDQADNDSDGKGNACDPCPNAANPGAANCPGTVYQVKTGAIGIGNGVRISSLRVTAVAGTNVWAQLPASAPGYTGAANSGIRLIFGSAPAVAVGNEITVDGVVGETDNAITLSASSVEVTGPPASAPAPVVFTAADFLTQGAAANATLVTVNTITSGTTYNTSDWLLSDATGSFAVLGTIFSIPPVSAPYSSITGIVGYDGTNFYLMPRSSADIVD